uniref:Calmodulin binding transcription activator 1 n=1 Tax=Oryctolagus cuniculus TaxID=9986 RepID=A0A5F9CS35_RABIT
SRSFSVGAPGGLARSSDDPFGQGQRGLGLTVFLPARWTVGACVALKSFPNGRADTSRLGVLSALSWIGSVSQSVFCGTSTYCVLNTVPPIEDDHGNSNSSHVKIFLPKKLLECLPKCSSLPKERHRWNTNEGEECCWRSCHLLPANKARCMTLGGESRFAASGGLFCPVLL